MTHNREYSHKSEASHWGGRGLCPSSGSPTLGHALERQGPKALKTYGADIQETQRAVRNYSCLATNSGYATALHFPTAWLKPASGHPAYAFALPCQRQQAYMVHTGTTPWLPGSVAREASIPGSPRATTTEETAPGRLPSWEFCTDSKLKHIPSLCEISCHLQNVEGPTGDYTKWYNSEREIFLWGLF